MRSVQDKDDVLTYPTFLALLQLQCSLRRTLHLANGQEKQIRHQAIRSINERLHACPDYDDFLRRVIRSGVTVG